jgi:uncharacterized protein (TIRG00374 family)
MDEAKLEPSVEVSGGRRTLTKAIPWMIALILLLGLVFIALDLDQIRSVLGQASLQPVPYALASTLVAYLCISLSFALVSQLLGIGMRQHELMAVGFVSVILNHIVSSGGAAGYSVRYALMQSYGVRFRQVLTLSILHFYVTAIIMVSALPFGILYLITHAAVPAATAWLLGALAAIVILVIVLATGLVLSESLRQRLLGLIERLASTVLRRDLGPTIGRFGASFSEGVDAMRRRPLAVAGILGLIVVDWTASVVALWFSFRAFGLTLTAGEVVTGFVIGIVAGVASLIPAGLGVQEGSMAGVFALLGVSFERAVLASILFRVLFYVIPYLISLGFYTLLMRRQRKGTELEVEHAHHDV